MEHLFNWIADLAFTALCGIGLLWLVIFFVAMAFEYIFTGSTNERKAAGTASKVFVAAARLVTVRGKRRR